MPYLEKSNSGKLYYLDVNKDSIKPVLLLHGLGVNSASWALQVYPLVNSGYRVICPDMRGFGNSDPPKKKTSIRSMATDVIDLIDALRLNKVDLVGISMGGTVALDIAITYPEKVKHLVLINTFARLKPKNPAMLGYYIFRFILIHFNGLAHQAKAVAARIFPSDEQSAFREEFIKQVNQADRKTYIDAMKALALFNVMGKLPRIKNPALIITGERDTTIAVEEQAKLAKYIPGSRQIILPGAGHAASIDQPELFNQVLISFLDEPDQPG